jgi:hypothetical protein
MRIAAEMQRAALLPSSLFDSLFDSKTNVGRRRPAVAEPRRYDDLAFDRTCEVNASALPSWSLGLAR